MAQRALIIDDSLPLQKLIRGQLHGEGLDLHSAHDGIAGLAMAVELRPSVILLDVDMPDMDGFEVCRRLKGNALTSTIPVIFLTADFDMGDKGKGLELGAVDYITKPFKPEELRARVRRARCEPRFKAKRRQGWTASRGCGIESILKIISRHNSTWRGEAGLPLPAS